MHFFLVRLLPREMTTVYLTGAIPNPCPLV